MHNKELYQTIKDVYIYGYPILGMYELLHTQVLNPAARTTGFNEFSHTAAVASPKTTWVPAPNNDTTYSRAWLDVRKEPVIIETPDTNDRYYTIQLLDLFSETIINVGRRLNGTLAQIFAITGPDWKGKLPEGITEIKSKTVFTLAFLRVLIHNEQDLEEVKRIQNGFKICYLGEYLHKPEKVENDPGDLPEYNIENEYMFFETLQKVLTLTPTMKEDKTILKKCRELGIGEQLEKEKLEAIPEKLMKEACDEARKVIDECGMQFGEACNGWRIARKGIGNYGTDYLQRSVVWFKGALANQPEESLYPSTFQDGTGELLDGLNEYRLSFTKEELPPVSQFWSLTMYRFSDAFLVDNEINRYSIGDRTKGIVYDEDGGLTIYIRHMCPQEKEKKANWLPAPKEKFYLTLRLYGPSEDAIQGRWLPPAMIKTGEGVRNG